MSDTTESTSIKPESENNNAVSVSEKKTKKKKLKYIESILKDAPHNATADEKLEFVCQKFFDVSHEQKEYISKLKQFEQHLQVLRNERDQLQNDRNRLVLQKDKLETLCRELQKQNKVIQEESLSRARAEDEKRRQVSDHFQTSITNIQNQLNEYQSKNMELRDENQQLSGKLSEFIKQHEKTEEHVDKLMQTRNLELKLADAKLNKAQCLLDQEKAKSQQKILQLEEEVKHLKNRLELQKNIEDKLREQITFYKQKYQTFNKTMAESRKMFDSTKDEMDKLVKRIVLTERETAEWQGKWEISQHRLLELTKEHQKLIKEYDLSKKQIENLSGLCRALRNQSKELCHNNNNDDCVDHDKLNCSQQKQQQQNPVIEQEQQQQQSCEEEQMEMPITDEIKEHLKSDGKQSESECDDMKFEKINKNECEEDFVDLKSTDIPKTDSESKNPDTDGDGAV